MFFIIETEKVKGLKPIEALLYSAILNFTKAQQGGCLFASQQRLAEDFGVTRQTIINALKRLMDKGLVIDIGESQYGTRCYVAVDTDGYPDYKAEAGKPDGSRDKAVPRGEGNPQKAEDRKKAPADGGGFDFRQAVISEGVAPETADAWLEVRRRKRAVNTKVALDGFLRECRKGGITPAVGVRICAEQAWQSLRASWLERLDNRDDRDKGRSDGRGAPSLEIAQSIDEFEEGL